ncbi:MAG: DUF115 domain-containing protein, partial [Treponema sp.]|nr:DUF115 domain-containing protein [Treponema sp.]
MLQGNKQALHSRYNPQGEAERYINTLTLNSSIRFFILIEPGLGYLIPPLRKKNNTARIIALYAEDSGKEIPAADCPDSFWSPGSGVSLQDFLESEIPDTGAGDIKIIEWRPSLGVYGERYLRLLSETAEFIKRSDANTRTVRQFGRRWFRNFFRNLALLSAALCPVSLKSPLAVTGAGPGLEETIPFIKEEQRRRGLLVLAVSSSTGALLARGVEPDMVIATDGGGWALLHLYECLRYKKTKNIFALSLTAALPS